MISFQDNSGLDQTQSWLFKLQLNIQICSEAAVCKLIDQTTLEQLSTPMTSRNAFRPKIVHLLAAYGKFMAMQTLAQKFESNKAELAALDSRGETALHYAAKRIFSKLDTRFIDIVKFLAPLYSVENLLRTTAGDDPKTALELFDHSKAPEAAAAIKAAIKKQQMLALIQGMV